MTNERHLRYVLEIAKEGNITAAAQNLFISQPSLSNLLTSIEKELGAKLFDRSVSPMTVTYAGEKYIAAAEKIMGQIQELRHQIDDMNDSLAGRLHIGCGPQLSSFLIPAVLPVLMDKYPGVQFKLTEANRETLEEHLQNGTLDVLFSGESINNQNVESIPLLKQEMLFLAPKDFHAKAINQPRRKQRGMVVLNKELQSGFNTFLTAPRGGVLNPSARIKTISGSSFPCIDFHALGNMPMVLMKKGHQMRVIQNRIFSENQYIPNTILETDNAYTCLRMAESGIAATILPKMKDKQSVKKIEIFSFEKEYCRQTYLCYRKNTYFPKILGEFINVTRNVLQSGSI